MSEPKLGVFYALLFGATILFIPTTSIANAQEYEDRHGNINDIYYEDDVYYEEIQSIDRSIPLVKNQI